MPSRQDQLHSYQFSVQRVVAALVTHETDPARSPFRRAAGTAMASLLLAAIGVAGAAAYGAVTKDRVVDWRNETTVFFEKETGARYVYYKPDDKLHPVLNYASALLIAGSPQTKTVISARNRLAVAPLGVPMGIPGAPDSLPGPKDLLVRPWTLCSRVAAPGADPQSTLAVGQDAAGGYPLTVAKPGAAGDGLLVSAPDDTVYLIHGNRRFRIPQRQLVLTAFGWSGRQPAQVAPAVINAVPAGPDLRAPTVPGAGRRSTVLDARVGQLVRTSTQAGGFQSAVVLADGIVDISPVQATLLAADPPIPGRPIELDTARYGTLPRSQVRLGGSTEALPPTVPVPVNVTRSVCVRVPNAAEAVSAVVVDATVPDAPPAVGSGDRATTGADRVAVPAGRGALVESAASPNAPRGSGTVSVVTATGLRYPVAGPEVLANLGYSTAKPQQMPAELVALIPAGPALDPSAAIAAR